MTTPSTSYSANAIYDSVPAFIQAQDATNGYPLFNYILAMVSALDDIGLLSWDDVGAGVTVKPVNLEASDITPAYLVSSILSTDTSLTIFGTDSTWSQVNTSSAFVVLIEEERIEIPGGSYNWSAPTVTFSGVTRGYDGTAQAGHLASSGANGTLDLDNFVGAPGWSQILDIKRCPQYALPWLGQFIGIELAQDNTLTYEQTIEKITQRSGFQRATVASIVAEMVAVISAQSTTTTPLDPSQVIILENTALLGYHPADLNAAITSTSATSLVLTNTDSSWAPLGSNSSFVIQIDSEKILVPAGVYNWLGSPITLTGVTRNYAGTTAATHSAGAQVTVVGGTDIFGFDEYAMTILIPASYFALYTYDQLRTAIGGDGTYNAAATFMATLGGTYNDLTGSALPSSTSPYVNFVFRYRPAGIRIFIGAY